MDAAVIDIRGAVDREAARRDLEDQIGLVAAQIHVLEATLVDLLARFDAGNGWQGGGWRSLGHWLSMRTKFTPADSARFVKVAAKVDELPTLMADAREGRMSLGLLASAARIVTAENEERVAEVARVCTASQAQRVLGTYRSLRDEATAEAPTYLEPDLWWRTWTDGQGRCRVDAALDATTGELLEQARQAMAALLERDARSAEATSAAPGERGAGVAGAGGSDEGSCFSPFDSPHDSPSDSAHDAGVERGVVDGSDPSSTPSPFDRSPDDPSTTPAPLPCRPAVPEVIAALASTVLDQADQAGVRDRSGERFAVQVVCDIETLATALGMELDRDRPVRIGARAYLPRTGTHLTDAELVRMVCTGTVQLLVDDAGQPLWLGTSTRLFNRHQRRAFRNRNGGQPCCEFPGCSVTRFVHAHHILGVHDGDGPTDLDNGVLLCGFHHRELHRRGWRITRSGHQLTFWTARGECLGSSGPPGPAPGPAPDISRLPRQAGPPDAPPGLDPNRCRSGGGGEPLTSWGMDVLLHRLLTPAA